MVNGMIDLGGFLIRFSVRQALVFLPPKSYHQWNPLFIDEVACVLGLRPRLSWAAMDNGSGRTVADWIKFLQTSAHDQRNMLSILRGAKALSNVHGVLGHSANFAEFDHF